MTTPFAPPVIEGILTAPYVTVAEFRSAPTWMDTDDLIEGGVQGQQDAELNNVLLRASTWADEVCGGGTNRPWFKAHTVTENARSRVDRYGQMFLHPSDIPVRQITGVAYGANWQNMTALTDLTQCWVEDGRGILVASMPFRGVWSGSLEFGSVPAPGGEVFVQYQYVAGYVNTTLASPALAGATSLTVADPTGILPPSTTSMNFSLPGTTLRFWDGTAGSGVEEAVTVTGSGYTPGTNPVPVTATQNAHAAGVGVSELPAAVKQAVICYAVSLLLREDVTGEEPFGNTPFGPSARTSKRKGKGAGLIEDARCLLEPFKRIK